MTVNELIKELSFWANTYPEYGDFQVVMAGHDATGERQYDIPVTTPYSDPHSKKCILWDN